MNDIRTVTLELLRSGPAHNQLLSPLTPYLALCGADGPQVIHIPFEHRQLQNRLERLQYGTRSTPILESQREAEVREMGEAIGRVLGEVPALLSQLSKAQGEGEGLVHLRLSLSAFELGLLPFELAIAPDGFPGSGSPLFLQSHTPITLTREVRRGQQLPVRWNQGPRILFAFAAPAGLTVPAQDHLGALRRAIDPWVKIENRPEHRLEHVKAMLTVLPNATLQTVREACADADYTHVHVLAHGAPLDIAGDRHYGLALCSDTDPTQLDVVDGERLAIALSARDGSGRIKHRPTVVTLATCDSANIGSVVTPGGSIAHELHAAGIPWVIASQFPLWTVASAIAAEVLYAGFLGGADPRWLLYELRQRLRTDSKQTHDWASIVAYSTVPPDFASQVSALRDRQVREKLNVKFDRLDDIVGRRQAAGAEVAGESTFSAEFKSLCGSIRCELQAWRAEPVTEAGTKEAAERLGMSAASEKRIGIACMLSGNAPSARDAYEKSRDFYREALEIEPLNHWVSTQYLCIQAVLASEEDGAKLSGDDRLRWSFARDLVSILLAEAKGVDAIWALSSRAELTLLGVFYSPEDFRSDRALEAIRADCRRIRELTQPNAFPLQSTLRQFKRYLDLWNRKSWTDLAAAALSELDHTPRKSAGE